MNSKLWFLIAISLFLNSVSLVYAELPAELKGPFYTLTKSKSDNEVDSGLANLDRSKNNEAKIKSSLLGDASVYSSDSEDAQTYHTLYSSADSEP
ncbi:MAG: hypothetical protein KDD56_07495, partial [Bdellovibrionales bacterium]|nr:hypothetical protein [Bdellovibrionales bacterium]